MECFGPISIPRPGGNGSADRLTVPCGLCAACLNRIRSGWAARLQAEWKHSKTSYFVTLTYNDDHLPLMIDDDGQCQPTLDKSQIQRFLKRLRKANEKAYFRSTIKEKMPLTHFGLKIRYFLIGEYGTKTGRPHYHLLIFGLPGNLDTTNYLIKEAWKEKGLSIGTCYIGSVSDQSINYVAGYVINPKESEQLRICQFALMSRRPGIGGAYISKMKEWHNTNEAFYIPGQDGIKKQMPRYYQEKLFSRETREHRRFELLPKMIKEKELEMQKLISRGESPWLNIEQRKFLLTERLRSQSLKNKPL